MYLKPFLLVFTTFTASRLVSSSALRHNIQLAMVWERKNCLFIILCGLLLTFGDFISTTEECPEAIFIMCFQSIYGVMIQAFMVRNGTAAKWLNICSTFAWRFRLDCRLELCSPKWLARNIERRHFSSQNTPSFVREMASWRWCLESGTWGKVT